MSNEFAPENKVFVCVACGKISRDRYGNKAITAGWDVSCMINAQLFDEDRLVLNEYKRVVEIKDTV